VQVGQQAVPPWLGAGVQAGPLGQARLLEPFAMLWISLAVAHGYGREIAFDFMRR